MQRHKIPGKKKRPNVQLQWNRWIIVGCKKDGKLNKINKIDDSNPLSIECKLCRTLSPTLYIFKHDCRNEQSQVCPKCVDAFLGWNDSSVLIRALEEMVRYRKRV